MIVCTHERSFESINHLGSIGRSFASWGCNGLACKFERIFHQTSLYASSPWIKFGLHDKNCHILMVNLPCKPSNLFPSTSI